MKILSLSDAVSDKNVTKMMPFPIQCKLTSHMEDIATRDLLQSLTKCLIYERRKNFINRTITCVKHFIFRPMSSASLAWDSIRSADTSVYSSESWSGMRASWWVRSSKRSCSEAISPWRSMTRSNRHWKRKIWMGLTHCVQVILKGSIKLISVGPTKQYIITSLSGNSQEGNKSMG